VSNHLIPADIAADFRDQFEAAFPGRFQYFDMNAPAGQIILVALPDLTQAEQDTLADLLIARRSTVNINLSDWQTIKAELPTLRTFMQAATPTNAQAIAAEKSIIRVLNAILRTN
jgi:hypothetical protein